jgi:hypothetical protein
MNSRKGLGFLPCVYLLSLTLQICTAHAADVWVKKVRNSTELVNAMLTAGNSGMPAIIKVVPGTYSFTQAFDSDFGSSVLPPVHSDITLEGANSATTVLDGRRIGGGVRVLTVLAGGRLALRHLTVSGGVALCYQDSCDLNGGGGIANYGGSVQLEHCVVSNNLASGIEAEPTSGGGILNVSGSLRIDDTRITGNRVRGAGGGLALLGGDAIVNRSTVAANATSIGVGNGGWAPAGGILVGGDATLTMDTSTIADNRTGSEDDGWAGFGAGIQNFGTVRLSHSAVIRNVAISIGAGGGIYNGGSFTILDSTVGDNSAGTRGGGVYNEGSLVLKGATIAGNSTQGGFGSPFESTYPPNCNYQDRSGCIAGGGGIWNEPGASARMVASLIANNDSDCYGTLTTQGHNILGVSTHCTLQRSAELPSGWTVVDHVDVSPLIGVLKSSAEPGNAYYPLLPDSPAIDAGGRIYQSCSIVDQTIHTRVDGNYDGIARCDIGAIEYRPR